MSGYETSSAIKNSPLLSCISSITYNGLHLVCLDSHNDTIIFSDKNFTPVKSIHLECKYSSICFDYSNNCYFATNDNSGAIIYKLNKYFDKIDEVHLENAPKYPIIQINYDKFDDLIWICFSDCVGYIKKESKKIVYVPFTDNKMFYKAILHLEECTLVSFKNKNKECLSMFFNDSCFDVSNYIPNDYSVIDICFGASKNKIAFLLSNKNSNKKFIMICSLICCDNQVPKLKYESIKSLRFDEVNNCDNNYHEHDKHNNHCNCSLYMAKSQIINSIALQEAGIAHILNAEGEKIQKAVAKGKSTQKLIDVNESVLETIIHLTQLETQLYLKLESVMKDCSCDSCYKKLK